MLRLRLFYGLLTLAFLLWVVGAVALLLTQESVNRFDTHLHSDYRMIDASQAIRTLTATLDVNYWPTLAGELSDQPLDRALFDNLKKQLQDHLTVIESASNEDARWHEVVARLDQVMNAYFSGYETYFSREANERKGREQLMLLMSARTQRLTDISGNVIHLSEQKLFSGAKRLRDDSRKNSVFVTVLALLGTSVAALIYFQLVRHLVDPVAALQRSITEISKGNFELTLPKLRHDSEFVQVVSAFNSMAAELKLRRGESDENLMRANLVNRAILAANPSPVFVLGDDSGIVQINPSAEQLTTQLGTTGRLPLKIQSILDECRESGNHFLPEDPREALLFRIDEKEFFYLPRIFHFEADDTKQSGWAVLLHDVSHIRWLDDMKTNLISTVSHEIKTPLTGIRMVLHLLLEERSSPLDKMQKIMVTSANDDCERLLVTLNSLLDLSRAESGATYLEREPLGLLNNVQRSAHLYESAASDKDIEIIVENGNSDFPEISADPIRLDEVLSNLVSNAVKHSPRGGKVRLRLSKLDSNYLRVTISDEGPGVPEESQSRIFERFYRAPGQLADGVGLGLFISREIMRAHEGRIGLCERTSNLTEFYIDVPID